MLLDNQPYVIALYEASLQRFSVSIENAVVRICTWGDMNVKLSHRHSQTILW